MSASRLLWHCDICRETVEDGNGWVTIDLTDVRRAERAQASWDDTHPGSMFGSDISDISDLPDDVPWHVYHESCDPNVAEEHLVYSLDINRIRSAAQVVFWQLHLSEKPWIGVTTWNEFVRSRALPQLEEGAA
jgi:hypothetical protein